MCGKFTTKASWTEIVDFSWSSPDDPDDRILTRRVMDELPVIVLEGDQRRAMPMRWGFPHPDKWQVPQPIHARSKPSIPPGRLRRLSAMASAASC